MALSLKDALASYEAPLEITGHRARNLELLAEIAHLHENLIEKDAHIAISRGGATSGDGASRQTAHQSHPSGDGRCEPGLAHAQRRSRHRARGAWIR